MVRLGLVWFGLVWFGLVWFGWVVGWVGLDWLVVDCRRLGGSNCDDSLCKIIWLNHQPQSTPVHPLPQPLQPQHTQPPPQNNPPNILSTYPPLQHTNRTHRPAQPRIRTGPLPAALNRGVCLPARPRHPPAGAREQRGGNATQPAWDQCGSGACSVGVCKP